MPLDQRTRSNEYAGVIGYPGCHEEPDRIPAYGLDAASAERCSAADPPEYPRRSCWPQPRPPIHPSRCPVRGQQSGLPARYALRTESQR